MGAALSGAPAIILAAVLWGTTGTAAHLLPGDVSPLATGSATMVVGGVLLFTVSARASLAVLRDRRALLWVCLGAVGVFVYPLAFYSSMRLAGVAVGTVVSLGAAPVFAALLEWLVDGRRPTVRWLIGAVIAVCGVVLLAGTGSAGTQRVPGVLLGLLAAASYALYTYAAGRAIARGHASPAVMGAMFGAGAVLLLPVLIATGAPLLQSWPTIGVSAYLAVGPMFIAYLLFGSGLRTVPASTATVITLIEPVVATVLAVTVVGERFGVSGWIGLTAVGIGIAVLVVRRPWRLLGSRAPVPRL